MRMELDILLKDPLQTINLDLINDTIHDSYVIIHHAPNHYLTLASKSTKLSMRVHEDGRIYLKSNPDSTERGEVPFTELMAEMNKFLATTYLANDFSFKKEFNFSFYGAAAHSYYWKKIDELNLIGKEKFGNFNVRTFSFDEDSIHIKLEAVEVFNLGSSSCMGVPI